MKPEVARRNIEIRKEFRSGKNRTELSKAYSLSLAYIGRIVQGKDEKRTKQTRLKRLSEPDHLSIPSVRISYDPPENSSCSSLTR